MNQLDYDRWWPLHLRASRGEQLSETDRQFYADGLQQLHLAETSSPVLPAVEAARRTIAELEQQQSLLRARRDELESEIAATEAALSQRARHLLGAKD